MKRMFQSATLKLTGSYLLILVIISLIFSFIIFELSTAEISSRLESLQVRLEGSAETLVLPGPLTLSDVRANQTNEARANIFFGLVYMNIAVVGVGGIGAYLLARRTLQPIEEIHEAQSRFTSDASHELRTPLAIMKSEIQVALKDSKLSRGELIELLESNLEEVDKLSTLSQSLLQLARLDYGDIPRGDRIDMSELIHQSVKSLDASKRVKLSLTDRPTLIEGNSAMIADLLRILLDNALKYSPPSSEVELAVTSNGRTCKLLINNEGPGIDPKDLPHIFDRFYRGDRSRTSSSKIKSYGLGLSLAKKIVDLHDGQVSVQSTPGEITRFSVSLPQIRKNR